MKREHKCNELAESLKQVFIGACKNKRNTNGISEIDDYEIDFSFVFTKKASNTSEEM